MFWLLDIIRKQFTMVRVWKKCYPTKMVLEKIVSHSICIAQMVTMLFTIKFENLLKINNKL